MLLTADIGNTETVIGLFEGFEPLDTWRVATERHRTGDEIALQLASLLDTLKTCGKPERAVLASVVPELDRSWDEALARLAWPAVWIDWRSDLPIRLEVDEPHSVGADRVVNTLAASRLHGRNTIVVDLGTATTFDCITADGAFLGGVIAPGPRAGIDRLHASSSKLPSVQIAPPSRVLGRNTVAALESGVFYSVVEGIDGIVRRLLAEWEPDDPLVVATGGLAGLVGPHCRCVAAVDPLLTLKGLVCADRHLRGEAT
ncbi:MAG: type III pantothenate kinase [Gemmatimonadota bacterium]|nr:type III pantothenate kinase [Gemmatimonadota bacterium]